jgi:uncharacterized membrane protein YeiH
VITGVGPIVLPTALLARRSATSMQAALELIGIFAFAVSGALLAIRRDFDIVGIAILALTTALGGGILRDLLLGDTPPPALVRWQYLVVPLAAGAVALVAHPELERLTRTLLVFDAAGLGLFCVTGTVKALEHGLAPVAAAAMFGIRCLALHRHWRGLRAWRR